MTDSCAYCGAEGPTSRDHVPPRGLFADPLPGDLITVPSCAACHANTSDDDQHFRDVLLSAAPLADEPRATRARQRVFRSLKRPQQLPYSLEFVRSMADVDVFSEGGIWLGRQPGIPLTPRIGRVVERIARGHYWRERGVPVPATHEVTRARLDQSGRELRLQMKFGMPRHLERVACGGQFAYTFRFFDDDPESGVWIGEFFGRVWAAANVFRRPA